VGSIRTFIIGYRPDLRAITSHADHWVLQVAAGTLVGEMDLTSLGPARPEKAECGSRLEPAHLNVHAVEALRSVPVEIGRLHHSEHGGRHLFDETRRCECFRDDEDLPNGQIFDCRQFVDAPAPRV